MMYNSDSDLSDDAPDDVTFHQSKEANSKIKEILSNTEKDRKQDRKLKNKRKEDLFKVQKQAKIAKLEAQRLPDDILEALPDEDDEQTPSLSQLVGTQATRTQFSSDDEEHDDVDSGINSTITSKVSVKEVAAIKTRIFSSALEFKSLKEQGCNADIKRRSAKERQFLREKKKANRTR